MRDIVKQLYRDLENSSYTVLLVGEGLSRELDIVVPSPLEQSVWSRYGVYYTSEGFKRSPEKAWFHYIDLIKKVLSVRKPNVYNHISELVEKGFIQSIISADIACIHRIIGLDNVIEIYGCILKYCCNKGHCITIQDTSDIPRNIPPICKYDNEIMRPSIVFYQEKIDYREWIKAVIEAETAELMIVIGLEDYSSPVNLLPILVKRRGKKLVAIGSNPNSLVHIVDYWIDLSATKVFEELTRKLYLL